MSCSAAPACNPTLAPVILMNAGALQPELVRQLTAPFPCLPPTINPALVILGITATQLACFKTPEGIWLLEAIFWTTCAAAFSIFDASAAKAKVVTKRAKPSVAH